MLHPDDFPLQSVILLSSHGALSQSLFSLIGGGSKGIQLLLGSSHRIRQAFLLLCQKRDIFGIQLEQAVDLA